jgi:uncharacterized membrane protein
MIVKKRDGRLWEIDLIRGIAIILMVVFHFLYDLNHFSITRLNLYNGVFSYISSITASIFVFIAGISLTISYNRSKLKQEISKIKIRFVKRGIKLLFLGFVITILSWLYIPERFVIFGILHCIGISIILSIPFIKKTYSNILFGSILIISGIILRTMTFDFNWLIPFGFLPPKYFYIDYFPILPWFGLVLIGISFGNLFYPNANRRFHLKDRSNGYFSEKICFIGRHSLHIYFIHQPILVSLIFIFLLIL